MIKPVTVSATNSNGDAYQLRGVFSRVKATSGFDIASPYKTLLESSFYVIKGDSKTARTLQGGTLNDTTGLPWDIILTSPEYTGVTKPTGYDCKLTLRKVVGNG